uniref:EGF-like domain-containing protein n=1 Tax=Strigamia maritima TaxID=126957 RepID=T1JAV4_STRMM
MVAKKSSQKQKRTRLSPAGKQHFEKMELAVHLWMIITSNLVIHCYGCTQEQSRFGCRIQEKECLCGVGCEIEYRYSSREDCLTALNGLTKDACSIKPCKNRGVCTNKSTEVGFICHCTATGYYGVTCEIPCPRFTKALRNGLPVNFPSDCVVCSKFIRNGASAKLKASPTCENSRCRRLEKLDDDDLEKFRLNKLDEMKKLSNQNQEWRKKGHGEYTEITELTSNSHIETRFVKLNVERAPFLCKHLRIRVLPTIALIKNGKIGDYIDDLGGVDDFKTDMLEWRIARSSLIFYSGDLMTPPDSAHPQTKKSFVVQKKTIRSKDEDSSDDDE